MTKARLEEVIIVESNRGLGRDESDPVRTVTSIFRKDGTLLAEVDPENDYNKGRVEFYKATISDMKRELRNGFIPDLSESIPFPEQ
jgi:hypothetical protein